MSHRQIRSNQDTACSKRWVGSDFMEGDMFLYFMTRELEN